MNYQEDAKEIIQGALKKNTSEEALSFLLTSMDEIVREPSTTIYDVWGLISKLIDELKQS